MAAAGISFSAPSRPRSAPGRPRAQRSVPRAGAGASGADRQALPAEQVAGIQRSRLLSAAIRTMEELGYAETNVAHITGRARVSRRTFYEQFANREECLAAALEGVVALIEHELAAASLEDLPWRERVRGGLWTILSFLDREPELARVLIVEALRGGDPVRALRERVLARLAAVVDEGRRGGSRASSAGALTAEGLVGAALAIVHARLANGSDAPLRDLLGETMGLIVLPYLGAAAARHEQTRALPRPDERAARDRGRRAGPGGDLLEGLPMRLTYRTLRVLECASASPGLSNRALATAAGIADQGQVSKLLARLERLGLLANDGAGHLKGEPNAWKLTADGERVVRGVRARLIDGRRAA